MILLLLELVERHVKARRCVLSFVKRLAGVAFTFKLEAARSSWHDVRHVLPDMHRNLVNLIWRRWWSLIIETATVVRACWRLIRLIFTFFVSVEPVVILCILNRDVGVFNNAHEDVLYDRNDKENEQVHENLRVPKVRLLHRMVSVEQSITSLNREKGVKSASPRAERIFELPNGRY